MRGGYGLGVWKAIRICWPILSNRVSFVVENGRRVKFWRDVWCGDTPLCFSFPSLFALATSIEAWVRDCWSDYEEGEGWIPLFTRSFG